jgi:phosphomannomutase
VPAYIAEVSVPTPLTAFTVLDMKLAGAFMITASHNPARYNGIKFIPEYGGPAEDFITRKIEENLKQAVSEVKGKERGFSFHDVKQGAVTGINTVSDFTAYKKKLLSLIDTDLIKKMQPGVSLDTMFGAASMIMPGILREELGLEVKVHNDRRDPLFGGRLPDPSEKNLSGLKKEVLEEKLDLGIALDGDADRFGVIDGKGVFISPNNSLAIILNYLLETRSFSSSSAAARTVATTHLIDAVCKGHNIEVIETPVGFKYIGRAMRLQEVVAGGEESGGLSIMGHIPEKDGLLADLLMIEIQSYLNSSGEQMFISDYLEQLYKKYGYYYGIRLDIEVPDMKKPLIIDYFRSLKGTDIEGVKVTEIIDIDGAKAVTANGSWILVRASGTEPLIRCYIESKDMGYFKTLKDFAKKKISSI